MTTPSTLQQITTKIRRLTGRVSPQHISDSKIYEYVNTFYQYDFPENLRIFSNRGLFRFITQRNVDRYKLLSKDLTQPAFNELTVQLDGQRVSAADIYYNLGKSCHVSGYRMLWNQDREQFLNIYPRLRAENTKNSGTGSSSYQLQLANTPILQKSVSLGAVNSLGVSESYLDTPISATMGQWQSPQGVMEPPTRGRINYLTGLLEVIFDNEIPQGTEIFVGSTPYIASRPQAVLFFNNELIFRPVPDKEYQVEIEAFVTPSKFLSDTQNPLLKQWWQYIAYGAAKKIFEDSQDMDGVEKIMPEFKKQESLVLHRHIVQQTNQRTATIYTEYTNFDYNNYGNRF